MAKRADIVEQAPDFMKINLLDLIMLLDPSKTNKYTPLMVKLFEENYYKKNFESSLVNDFIDDLRESFKIDLENAPKENIPIMYNLLHAFDVDFVRSIMNFVVAAENNQLPELDVMKIKKISEIHEMMSLVQLKNISKKLQKQVLKDYEDNEWLIVRPFTQEASLKYGYGTKWCTSSENFGGHFFNYTKDGKLIYCINKIDGKKVAIFLRYEKDRENELSFWNMNDDRVDSMMCELPESIIYEVRNILFEKDNFSNRLLNEKVWSTSHAIFKKYEEEADRGQEEPMMEEPVIRNVAPEVNPPQGNPMEITSD